MQETLLHTKLIIPPRRPELVSRRRLLDRLDECARPGRQLGLVSAPAGAGKTTLISEWVARCQLPVAWLSLDAEDSDPVRFLRYVIASLQTVHGQLGRAILPAYHASPPPPLKTAVAAVINELGALPDRLVLVLDDYHLISAPPIHDALAFLLAQRPPGFCLVLATRQDPPLPLPRWRARGAMVEIREAELQFTIPETTSFLNGVMGLNLTATQVETLAGKTEGWVSGLQLAALSMRGRSDVDGFVRSFAGSNRFILDYLMEEVFRQQPPEVQSFLLQTAVLERLTAPLCAALLSAEGATAPDCQAMLERLDRDNLFVVPLDETRTWFRYHHLFVDLLRQRVRRSEADVAALHALAGAWLEAHGLAHDAVHHFLAAAAWEQAVTLIASLGDALQKRGENSTYLRWMHALPGAVIEARPHLCLDYAWALALSGRPDAAERYLDVAESGLRDDPERVGRVLSARIHVARTRHDLPRTIALSERALALIPAAADDPRSALTLNLGIAHWQQGQIAAAASALEQAQEAARRAQNHHVRLLAVGFLGMVQAAQGRLRAAATRMRTALAWGGAYPASALPHLVLGALCHEWNQLDEAARHLQQAMALAQRSGNPELESSAHRQQALLAVARGDHAAAMASVMQAISAAGEQAPPITRARNGATAVRVALAQNDVEGAQRYLAHMPTGAAASLFYAPLLLAPARLHLAQENKPAARAQLEVALATATQAGWVYGQIEIRLLQALAAADTPDALRFLADAMQLAQAEGFVRTFLDQGESLVPLLHTAASRQRFPDYARRLLAAFGGAAAPAAPPPVAVAPAGADRPPETMSERELEALTLLAEGRTYREIAAAMVVSVNTVKSHLKTIYGKLGVHNRRQAVARARAQGLLPGER